MVEYCTGATAALGYSVSTSTTYIGFQITAGSMQGNISDVTFSLRKNSGGTTTVQVKLFNSAYTLLSTSNTQVATSESWTDYTFTMPSYVTPAGTSWLMVNYVSHTGGALDIGGEDITPPTGLIAYRQTNSSQTFDTPVAVGSVVWDMCANVSGGPAASATRLPPPPIVLSGL